MQVVILAAGMGTRLGRPLPKPLTMLSNGRSILRNQIDTVRTVLGESTEILVVVGFKLEHILEAAPDVTFAYNEDYDCTNTSKSLLRALHRTGPRAVLWMNGDVVFDPEVLERTVAHVRAGRSFVCVDRSSVGEEEVKYTLDSRGRIDQLSKEVPNGLGEAVGINFVAAADKGSLTHRLGDVPDDAYFERGMELCIHKDGTPFEAIDISDVFAVEVDFESDLDVANEHF